MEKASIKFIAFFFVILAFASSFAQDQNNKMIPNDGATREVKTSCPPPLIKCSKNETCKHAGCTYCADPDEHAPYKHCH